MNGHALFILSAMKTKILFLALLGLVSGMLVVGCSPSSNETTPTAPTTPASTNK